MRLGVSKLNLLDDCVIDSNFPGIYAGSAGKIIRSISMVVHMEKKADIMPVDVAINLMYIVGWKTAQRSVIDPRNSRLPFTTALI